MPGVLAKEGKSIYLILSTEMLSICDSLFYHIKAQCLSDSTQSYFELLGNKHGVGGGVLMKTQGLGGIMVTTPSGCL